MIHSDPLTTSPDRDSGGETTPPNPISLVKPCPTDTLTDLIPSWTIALRAANRSLRTITSYLLAARQLIDFLENGTQRSDPPGENGTAHTDRVACAGDITATDIRGFLASVIDRGCATATVRAEVCESRPDVPLAGRGR